MQLKFALVRRARKFRPLDRIERWVCHPLWIGPGQMQTMFEHSLEQRRAAWSSNAKVCHLEGIETALPAAELFEVPAWSCISTSGAESFESPVGVREPIIFADHDAILAVSLRHVVRRRACPSKGTRWRWSFRRLKGAGLMNWCVRLRRAIGRGCARSLLHRKWGVELCARLLRATAVRLASLERDAARRLREDRGPLRPAAFFAASSAGHANDPVE